MKEWICKELPSSTDEKRGILSTLQREKELIRCKDCKYWLPHSQFGSDEDNEDYYDYCKRLVPEDEYYAFTRNADDFCSRAKRKDE